MYKIPQIVKMKLTVEKGYKCFNMKLFFVSAGLKHYFYDAMNASKRKFEVMKVFLKCREVE